ncbi:hypothetical protein HDV03_005130 [Kappamyces sp. JEL0829]|nr:hypothetical protein HDV03_005130 [Kappamyces sp. JEL0829]
MSLPPLEIIPFSTQEQLDVITQFLEKDLSEPYTVYTYRYFIHNWPDLTWTCKLEKGGPTVGVILCRLEEHTKARYPRGETGGWLKRGYIAMLAVSLDHRGRGIGKSLVKHAIDQMIAKGADEIVLETEETNTSALRLYTSMGFVKDKRLPRYYMNGVDAFRLKLWIR